MPIPDAADIANAVENLAAGLALDRDVVGVERYCWLCVVVDAISGKQLRAGVGLTEREAAADAWVSCLPVGQLLDAVLRRVPPPLPDGRVRLEIAPPGCWERVYSEQHSLGASRHI
jgi:hypothetical protein